ncbi:MAG: hypothetical protein CMA60_05650 [Euryarchaeota archaeon]|nr:hypothetical protein [Euryarchaeota archaeon]|tara:strand:+ start:17364 stop:17615 length:252 start_codon:yes stop_codon:yes gene_type:complete
MSNKKANKERYEDYAREVVDVGEELHIREIWDRVYDYNPYRDSPNPNRTFQHNDMPDTRGLGTVLRDSKHFVLVKSSVWLRVS